jgi:hypothetical protein
MFLIRYSDEYAQIHTVELSPRPVEVDYPEKRLFTARVTQDEATVIQRPLRDSRTRRWIWRGYRYHMAEYAAQWALLESLDAQARLRLGLNPVIEIFEDTSGIGGFGKRDGGGNPIFTKVAFVQVTRNVRAGGRVTYDESVIEFLIRDSDYNDF